MEFKEVEYFQQQLSNSCDEIADIRRKLQHDIKSVSIEEMYLLREILQRQAALARLFETAVVESKKSKRHWFRRK